MRRTYPAYPLVGVGAVVLNQDKLLLVKRGERPNEDTWTLPGGLVELGETIREALVREVREECNIEIEPTQILDVLDYIKQDRTEKIEYHYVIIDFEARYLSGILKPASDILDAKWFDKSALANLNMPEFTRAFLAKYYP